MFTSRWPPSWCRDFRFPDQLSRHRRTCLAQLRDRALRRIPRAMWDAKASDWGVTQIWVEGAMS